jgi:long-chain acyl-CoA synthetase
LHAVIVPDLEVMQSRKVVNMKEVLRFDIENISVHLPVHKRILSYEIQMEALARTPTRKLKRFEVERQLKLRGAENATGNGAAPELTEEEMAWAAQPEVARALEVLREAAHDKSAVRANANLELDLGFDSIERVEVLTNLEQLFGTRIPTETAHAIYNVRQLVEAVCSQSSTNAKPQTANAWSKLLKELPDSDPLFKDLLKPYPVVTFAGFVLLKVWGLAGRLLLQFRVTGIENLPSEGAYLICPNHETYLDPFFLASALPYSVFRKLFYVGASEYFETPFRRRLARWMHLAPVDPDANLVRALQAGAYGLKKGKILVLFPEGERSIDGEVKKFKKGAAILASHLEVPIVPVGFDGVFPVWPRNRAFSWRAFLPWNGTRVRLHFGKALRPLAPSEDGVSQAAIEARYAAATEQLRRTVMQLKSELQAKAALS